jgi:hypothetical protein
MWTGTQAGSLQDRLLARCPDKNHFWKKVLSTFGKISRGNLHALPGDLDVILGLSSEVASVTATDF